MKQINNVIEYEPGDITYLNNKNPKYKLQEPESPIIEMWTEQYNIFYNKAAKTPLELKILGINVIFAFVNTATYLNSDVLAGTNMCISIAATISFFIRNPKIKRKKFEYAIFHYQELKEYEELYPEKTSIINNPTLKGVSKRKMKKRVKSLKHCKH